MDEFLHHPFRTKGRAQSCLNLARQIRGSIVVEAPTEAVAPALLIDRSTVLQGHAGWASQLGTEVKVVSDVCLLYHH